tara:strand:+ start:812 stop:973 length:162 start_codon:yes stop_codon:yes gene_type:complete
MDDMEFSVLLPDGVDFDYSTCGSFYENNHGVLSRQDEALFDDYSDDEEEESGW